MIIRFADTHKVTILHTNADGKQSDHLTFYEFINRFPTGIRVVLNQEQNQIKLIQV